VTVPLPEASRPGNSELILEKVPGGRARRGGAGAKDKPMTAFFRDLIEFLREFSSVPVEDRAAGPSPRRVQRDNPMRVPPYVAKM
jgi:hypothetical protein